MIALHQLWTFAVAALLLVLIPGPNMTFLVACAASQGRRAAFVALLGSNVALVALAVIVGLGLGTLLHAVPLLFTALKVSGALYLFWLAWKSLRNGAKTNISAARPSRTNLQLFRAGFLTNFLNPKSYAFYIAIFPGFLDPRVGYVLLQGALLGLTHAIICFLVIGAIIFSVRYIAGYFNAGSGMQVFKRWFAAVVFTVFGIRMLM